MLQSIDNMSVRQCIRTPALHPCDCSLIVTSSLVSVVIGFRSPSCRCHSPFDYPHSMLLTSSSSDSAVDIVTLAGRTLVQVAAVGRKILYGTGKSVFIGTVISSALVTRTNTTKLQRRFRLIGAQPTLMVRILI